MASIFTWDPEPWRVTSPWLRAQSNTHSTQSGTPDAISSSTPSGSAEIERRITRLEAEPQQGPVEYKLHLLLRPRRKFCSTSTGSLVSGSRHSQLETPSSVRNIFEASNASKMNSGTATPQSVSTQQTRQHRLEQLTTQLLWRLQQSSPHHTSSATNIILPSLPEALPELHAPRQLAKLLHGLEESQGALYEIGVSDDGTLVGLANDELDESLNNLRAMAACLGCTVEVLRTETVGICEWMEESSSIDGKEQGTRRTGKLLVAEALIKPHFPAENTSLPGKLRKGATSSSSDQPPEQYQPATEQLRVTLAGPTMSGKSTLLGTLTTSTLDNGRGKSRLNMLKHRHEINSGITSSVTQELLGYRDSNSGIVHTINYASDGIASWIDVHVAAVTGRLVLISDSAGHPRYRRTTVRGLVGWAPHWTLLCVPADASDDLSAGTAERLQISQQGLGASASEIDLSGAQLDLCLRLGVPLVIVVTKLDIASRNGLKNSLSRLLDVLKTAGRKPVILPISAGVDSDTDLSKIDISQLDHAYSTCIPLLNDAVQTVPIVLTSAVQGTGIQQLHALLHELPVPSPVIDHALPTTNAIFHIEDIYTKPAEINGLIVSGRLRSGKISISDRLFLGPFSRGHEPWEDSEDSDERTPNRKRSSTAHLTLTSQSFPGALRPSHLMTAPYLNIPSQEWRRIEVFSVRNLRLPVHSLHADQVGTVAITAEDKNVVLSRVRKGMILSSFLPQATRTFVASFRREDFDRLVVGNHVVVYTASVRASAKVISTSRAPLYSPSNNYKAPQHFTHSFAMDDDKDDEMVSIAEVFPMEEKSAQLLVTFAFDAAKEFVIVGDPVLVMPGGGPGRITDIRG
ncbi:MAG: hypothetical protein FE78DRAFT_81474 [Acidomyces sp. 'richmondensis']|nr:MAG: hypothetical protein FE78DRAFT_81474 [Acidomyces sp. 'richmondensis']